MRRRCNLHLTSMSYFEEIELNRKKKLCVSSKLDFLRMAILVANKEERNRGRFGSIAGLNWSGDEC